MKSEGIRVSDEIWKPVGYEWQKEISLNYANLNKEEKQKLKQ
jgi:hypothetical protein